MRYSTCKIIDATVRQLLKAGWHIKRHNRHMRLAREGDSVIITVPGSPSDHRATKNWLCQLRRTGVQLC